MKILYGLTFIGALAIAGCADVAQVVGSTAQELSSSTPAQVRTLSEALQAATIATNAVDVYVNGANPDMATLLELQTLNDGLHTALVNLRAANANNQSLLLGLFNESLRAFQAYSTNKGIAH